jgi:hypothetical protein
MSQPAADASADPLPYTHELQQRLLQSHADLTQLAEARKRGDDAAADALVKRLQPVLTELAKAADRGSKQQQQQQQQANGGAS